jgi:branched-chain amino acid transport system permease protein
MIVLGGLGSMGGAIIGAVIVTSLPLIFTEYAGSLPLVSEAGAGGLQAGDAARYLYGAAIIATLIFAPRGLAGLLARTTNPRQDKPPTPTVTTTKESTA